MEGAWVAWVQTAIAAGMTPAEIGGAAGISDPPAVLGLTDVEFELEHRLDRGLAS